MTYNFYQSSLWQQINRDIYRKPTGMITIGDQAYQYIIKQKSILGVTVNRYQILGVELPSQRLHHPREFREYVMGVLRREWTSSGDCFVQLGFIHQLGETSVDGAKSDGYHSHRDQIRRQQSSAMMCLGGYDSLVENMPAATVVVDLKQSLDDIFAGYSSRTRTQIRKAEKSGLCVEQASQSDWNDYYDMRSTTGDIKGFAIQSREAYDQLHHYLISTKQGQLYVVRDGNIIVAGAICVSVGDVYVYLYGATRRGGGNMGHAQLLHWEIMKYAKQLGFQVYDFLGCAPGSLQPHRLDGVTQFKMSFGGSKIEYGGNYDFPLSGWKYDMFKRYRTLKTI